MSSEFARVPKSKEITNMQSVAIRKDRAAEPAVKRPAGKILYFTLQGELPVGSTLVLNTRLGTLSYLLYSEDMPRLVMQQQFTNSEMSLLIPLLEYYPHYCPHEVMFANFYNAEVSDLTIARCRERLQEALDYGTWDQEMRPVRNVLSRTRIKMRTFGIDILSILETGYMLTVTSTPLMEE